ncbi:MAG: hypothetical protein ABSF71_25875 [Terriglobia bacterium]|jgi:heme/copper-type cytochrome/quinol oxidase subunit 2
MEHFLSPAHLLVLLLISIVVIVLGTVAIIAFRKTREKELQYHQDLHSRETEHQAKMKALDIEMEKAKGRSSTR